MATPYNSNYHETTPFSDTCAQIALATGADQTYTVPGNDTINYSATFGYNSTSNVYVCLNSVAVTPPAGTATTVQFQELRPTKKYVKGGDVLHFVTPDATAQVSVSLMRLPG